MKQNLTLRTSAGSRTAADASAESDDREEPVSPGQEQPLTHAQVIHLDSSSSSSDSDADLIVRRKPGAAPQQQQQPTSFNMRLGSALFTKPRSGSLSRQQQSAEEELDCVSEPGRSSSWAGRQQSQEETLDFAQEHEQPRQDHMQQQSPEHDSDFANEPGSSAPSLLGKLPSSITRQKRSKDGGQPSSGKRRKSRHEKQRTVPGQPARDGQYKPANSDSTPHDAPVGPPVCQFVCV